MVHVFSHSSVSFGIKQVIQALPFYTEKDILNPFQHKVFIPQEHLVNFEVSDKEAGFLKDFIVHRLKKKDLVLPPHLELQASKRRGFETEYGANVNKIIFTHFAGFVEYFFNFVNKPEKIFMEKVQKTSLPEPVKKDLYTIYSAINDYYTLTLKDQKTGKSFNLMHLDNHTIGDLKEALGDNNQAISHELIAQSGELKQVARQFASSETERIILYNAGKDSREILTKLVAGILMLTGVDHYVKPVLVKLLGGESTAMGAAVGKITEFVAGTGDDILGGYKDYLQDKVTIGRDTALNVLFGGTLFGILVTLLAVKQGFNSVGKAIVYAYSAAASNVYSTAAASSIMYKNFNKLHQSNIVDTSNTSDRETEKSFFKKAKNTIKNYLLFDAYFAKIIGLLACIPAGFIAFKSGGLNKEKVSSFRFVTTLMLLVSTVNIVSIPIQILRNRYRQAKIQTSKEMIANGQANINQYNPRKFYLEGTADFFKTLGNFMKNSA